LGWHIILACFGVGMPTLTVFAEWRSVRTGDDAYIRLAHRWAKAEPVKPVETSGYLRGLW
jgi:cytochrome d ubiquinol oxidase subunit I